MAADEAQYEKPIRPILHLPPPPPGPPPPGPPPANLILGILGAEYPPVRRLHMRKSVSLSNMSPMQQDYFAPAISKTMQKCGQHRHPPVRRLRMRKSVSLSNMSPMQQDYFALGISKTMQECGQHGHPQTMAPMSMPPFQLGPMPSGQMLPYAQMKTPHGIQFSQMPPPNIMHQKNMPPQGSPSSSEHCQHLIQGQQLPQKQEYKFKLGSRDDTDSHQVGRMGFSAAHHQLMYKVTATVVNVPTSFKTFKAAGFPPKLLQKMHSLGIVAPTPLQALTWPIAFQKIDILAIAKTGCGKTLGYLISAFSRIWKLRNDRVVRPKVLTVLVLAPTQEVATKIQHEAITIGQSIEVSCTCLYGGSAKSKVGELEIGADIVVATPNDLIEIFQTKKDIFKQVSILVLDETDKMLDMGFAPHICEIVKEIPKEHQTHIYTATWPKKYQELTSALLKEDHAKIAIGKVDTSQPLTLGSTFLKIPKLEDSRMEMVAVGLLSDNGHHYFSYFSPHDLSKNPSRHPYLFFLPQGAYVDITSCEGVLCFNSFDGRVVVCNLTTQQLQFLPPTRPLNPKLYEKSVVSCGFGYDSISKDYKVIRCYKIFRHELEPDGTQSFGGCVTLFELYSFREQKWRNIPTPFPKPIICCTSGSTFIDGSFYWISAYRRDDSGFGSRVLAFNFANESFTFFSLPHRPPDYRAHLVKIDDASLGVVLYGREGNFNSFELWVWSGNSWSVVYDVEVFDDEIERMLGLVNGKQLFFVRDSNKQLIVCDLKKKELKELDVYSNKMMLVSYVQSGLQPAKPMPISSYDAQEGWDKYWENSEEAIMNCGGYEDVGHLFLDDD